MNDLLDKTNPPPIRLADNYTKWSAAIVLMYLLMRFVWRRNVGKLDLTGIAVGLAIGILWSLATLIRAYVLARKNIFVEKQNQSRRWHFVLIIIELLIPLAFGYCVLLLAKAEKINFNFYDAVWSLIFSIFFAFFLVSSLGYYFLEWRFGKKFFDRPDK
jgi:hypothetical protein